MTVDDLVAIVCGCLDEIGMTPEHSEAECAEWTPEDLDLDDVAIVQLLTCVSTKVKEHDQTVVVGKTMWKKAKSVRHFCVVLSKTLE